MNSETAEALEQEMAWITALTGAAVRAHLDGLERPGPAMPPPEGFLKQLPDAPDLHREERVMLALALATLLAPAALDPLSLRNPALDRPFTEFGGRWDGAGCFVPTLQTALFLCGAQGPGEVLDAISRTGAGKRLIGLRLLAPPGEHQPRDGTFPLRPGPGLPGLAGTPEGRPTRSGTRLLHTDLDTDDLILPEVVHRELDHLRAWLQHGREISTDWGLGRHLATGYRALFHGPPGTGKTLTAALLGKTTGLDVLHVDLSQVISKFIGETEKNLAGIFDDAAARDQILFFDEADALFSRRTVVTSSNDRFANQEVAYLLQRLENSPGLTILASNLRDNIDPAFMRRFQSVIWFPMPGAAERLRIWRRLLSEMPVAGSVDADALAQRYEVSGATIKNAALGAALAARAEGQKGLSMTHLQNALRRELRKLGKAEPDHD